MSQRKAAARSFLLGGALPILAFVVVEQIYGTVGGIIAGLVFGAGEIAWELKSTGKVQRITLFSNALVLVLGLLSLWEGDGFFFKMQPAIFLLVFAAILIGSSFIGTPFLLATARKQNPNLPPVAEERIRGLNTRVGFLFLALAALSAYSAAYWSTAAWATLKTVGMPLILVAYILLEGACARFLSRKR